MINHTQTKIDKRGGGASIHDIKVSVQVLDTNMYMGVHMLLFIWLCV